MSVLDHWEKLRLVSALVHKEAAQGYIKTPAPGGLRLIPALFIGGVGYVSHAHPQGGLCRVLSLAHMGAYLVSTLAHGSCAPYQRSSEGELRIYNSHPQGTYAIVLSLVHMGLCLFTMLTHRRGAVSTIAHRETVQVHVQALAHGGNAPCLCLSSPTGGCAMFPS